MPEYVNWLRHASPYINAHRDCTFVVMLPGDGVEHPNFGNIVHDIVLLHSLGVRLVLVHGSRPQIETRLAARGLTPHYHHGMRITDAATLEWLGRFIGRIHAVGAIKPYQHRPVIDINTFGVAPRNWLLQHDFIPTDLLQAYQSVSQQALDGVARCYDRAGEVALIRLHGDCHMGNVLWLDAGDQAGPHFVDFDDSRMGPGIQDLWMLLSGSRQEMQIQLTDILVGYEDFFEFEPRQLYLVEALRTLRLLHYSTWLAQRWADPAFTTAFPWFNTQRYWQDRILELREQVALMDEPPLWPV